VPTMSRPATSNATRVTGSRMSPERISASRERVRTVHPRPRAAAMKVPPAL
jgi:hypothetical protein